MKVLFRFALIIFVLTGMHMTAVACDCGDDDDDNDDAQSDLDDDTASPDDDANDDVNDDVDDDVDDDVNDDADDDADDDTSDTTTTTFDTTTTTTTTVTTTTSTTTTTDDGLCRFRVNSSGLDENTWKPDVAMSPSGSFIVVWYSYEEDRTDYDVFGRLYSADGTPQGEEFLVNTTTNYSQSYPAAAMDDEGKFVVVWVGPTDAIAGDDVYGQLFEANGDKIGSEFLINTYSTDRQYYPDVATDSDGDFVVVWQSNGQDGDECGVFGQRFDSAATPQGSEFQINTTITDNQLGPRVAMDNDGDFVVAWLHAEDAGPEEVYAQRYDAAGVAQGAEFQVNTYTDDLQFQPTVAMNGGGDFIVSWTSNLQDGFGYGVYGQMYAADGTAIGAEFRANTMLEGGQNDSDIARNAAGNFVIVWDDHGDGAFAQRYDNAGSAVGGELTVYEHDDLLTPRIAMDATGNIVVVWRIECQGGAPCGLFGRRFDSDGNQVCP